MKIIFAQGNPGAQHAKSRHNVGFLALDALADKLNAKWTEKSKFQAYTTEILLNAEKAILVKPNTYYNETGNSIRKIVDFYKIDPTEDLLVIHDDFALPFGAIRVREKGSDAGNNGIKSINSSISQDYMRIRIGIWTELRDKMDDADFVLAKFNSEEVKGLEDKIIPKTIDLIDQFCGGFIKSTSYKVLE